MPGNDTRSYENLLGETSSIYSLARVPTNNGQSFNLILKLKDKWKEAIPVSGGIIGEEENSYASTATVSFHAQKRNFNSNELQSWMHIKQLLILNRSLSSSCRLIPRQAHPPWW